MTGNLQYRKPLRPLRAVPIVVQRVIRTQFTSRHPFRARLFDVLLALASFLAIPPTAFSATFSVQASWHVQRTPVAPLYFFEDRLWFLADDGYIYQIDITSGDVNWRKPIPKGSAISFDRGSFFALTSTEVAAYAPEYPTRVWKSQVSFQHPFTLCAGENIILCADNWHICALAADSGNLLWTYNTPSRGLPIQPAGMIVAAHLALFSEGDHLNGLEITTGQHVFTASPPGQYWRFDTDGQSVYSIVDDYSISAFAVSSGEELWSTRLDTSLLHCTLRASQTDVFIKADVALYRIDRSSGRILWTKPVKANVDEPSHSLELLKGTITDSFGRDVYFRSEESGELSLTYRHHSSVKDLEAAGDAYYIISADGLTKVLVATSPALPQEGVLREAPAPRSLIARLPLGAEALDQVIAFQNSHHSFLHASELYSPARADANPWGYDPTIRISIDGISGNQYGHILDATSIPTTGQFMYRVSRVPYGPVTMVRGCASEGRLWELSDRDNLFATRPIVSENGERVAYIASPSGARDPNTGMRWRSTEWRVVDNGVQGALQVGAKDLVLTPDGRHIGYSVRTSPSASLFNSLALDDRGNGDVFHDPKEHWRMVVDGRPGDEYNWVSHLRFADDGARWAYVAKVDASPMCYIVTDSHSYETVYDTIDDLLISRDGKHLAFNGSQRIGTKTARVVHDGKSGERFIAIRGLTLSDDGLVVAYAAFNRNGWQVVWGAKKGLVYDEVSKPSLSRIGSQVAYFARRNATWILVLGNMEYGKFDEVSGVRSGRDTLGSPLLSADGFNVAYRRRVGDGWSMVVDAHESESFDAVYDFEFVEGQSAVVFGARRKDGLWRDRIVVARRRIPLE